MQSRTSLALFLLGIDRVDAYQAEDEVERVMEIALLLALVPHGVRDVRQERGEQAAQAFRVTRFPSASNTSCIQPPTLSLGFR